MAAPAVSPTMAVVLAAGTSDRLLPFATLVSGAVAMGYEVHVFASYWGLDALRRSRPAAAHPPVTPGHGAEGEVLERTLVERHVPGWRQILAAAKRVGPVHVYACSQSMDVLSLKREELDDLVDEVVGVATFVDRTRGASATYFV